MAAYIDMSISIFIAELASSAPVPGGGGGAALVGAIGAALGNMVGSLTVGKKKYADVEDEIIALKAKCDSLQSSLLELIDLDATSFAPLAAAYSIPQDDPGRDVILDVAAEAACQVPLNIMAACGEAIECVLLIAQKGSRLALSDAGCAAAFCKAALISAGLNVFINTKGMKDRVRAREIDTLAEGLLDQYCPTADGIFDGVTAYLRGGA